MTQNRYPLASDNLASLSSDEKFKQDLIKDIEKSLKRKEKDRSFQENFQYINQHPYNEKLDEFSQFIMKDHESELYKGEWNEKVFQRQARLNVEVGSGHGHFMIQYCEEHPDENFIGLDYKFKRTFEVGKKLAKCSNQFFRFLRAKGERLDFIFAEKEVDKLFYFFPDPWPKKRHHKKRLFQRPFLATAYQILKDDGIFYIKTDHDEYYLWMIEQLQLQDLFKIEYHNNNLWNASVEGITPEQQKHEHFLRSFETRFEQIFKTQGTTIKAIVLKKVLCP